MRNWPLSSETAKYGCSRTTIQARMWVWASQTTSTTPGFLIRCVMSTDWSLVGKAMLNTVRRSRNPCVLCRIGSELRIRTFAPTITADTCGTNRHFALSSSNPGARFPRSTPSRETTVPLTPLVGPRTSA